MEMLSVNNLLTLGMLIFLQAVLGFDNLLYISIESKRVPEDRQQFVRRMGIGLAIGLRILLLFVVVEAISLFQDTFCEMEIPNIVEFSLNTHSLIVLVGGGFIIYTAIKEIYHLLSVEKIDAAETEKGQSIAKAITWIVVMNLVFSFDSILSAMALTDVFLVMAIAILVSGGLMIWLADHVSEFLKKNRMYEVLGLFILFIVGVMLLSEGGHLAHLKLFNHPVEAMQKSTFYFVITVLVLIDLAQGRYQKKLRAQRERETTVLKQDA